MSHGSESGQEIISAGFMLSLVVWTMWVPALSMVGCHYISAGFSVLFRPSLTISLFVGNLLSFSNVSLSQQCFAPRTLQAEVSEHLIIISNIGTDLCETETKTYPEDVGPCSEH